MEKKSKFDPQQVLGDKITQFSRRELCAFGSKLCAQILEDAGPGNYRGGVYPENISLDEEGNIAIGPAKTGDWEGQEAEFIAPELFWHGQASPAADVYAVGMLLYYAVSGGTLPFAEQGQEKARAIRMSGESFKAPQRAGRRLGEIIAKATAFKTADRYKSVGEIKAMLDSCGENRYLDGGPSSELLFNKDEEQLSDVERLMVSIIEKSGQEDEPVPEEESALVIEEPAATEEAVPAEGPGAESEAAPEEEEPAPPIAGEAEPETAEPPVIEIPEAFLPTGETKQAEEEEPAEEAENPEESTVEKPEEEPAKAPEKAPEEKPAPELPVVQLREEKNPELEPVVPKRPITPAVQYGKSMERERKIAEKVKRRRRRPVVFVMMLCALLIIAAITVNAINNDKEQAQNPPAEASNAPEVEVIPPEQIPAEESPAPVESEAPAEPEQPKESTYQLFIEDVSWTEARDRCVEKGGHLVVISDDEELQKVIDLAKSYGVNMLWVGCHRVDGTLVWETDDQVSVYPWGAGEPSYMDSYDGVYEDYVMLWNNNGWVYNDSRNDPVADYPGVYSGKIAYVCEFEG
ncbi:MAG: lectin-like protein [Candidatus Limivicinus sp.]